ncbi:hypothetical protein RB653_000934 [Dictyostelium firmibasis]|uniref:Thioredoxin domain-containing protein n=1 Tax=Dictyostelium firmibasis TaxID=79012 RepID=A0AAN7Z1K4_9MYCE
MIRNISKSIVNLNSQKYATKSSFKELVLESKKPVIVDIRPCYYTPSKFLNKDLFEAIKEKNGSIELVTVDFDEEYDLAKYLKIQSFPTVVSFSNGSIVKKHTGPFHNKSQIQEFLNYLETQHNKEF